MKKVKRNIVILLLIICIFSFPLTVKAADGDEGSTTSSSSTAGNDFLTKLNNGVESFTNTGKNGMNTWGLDTSILAPVLAISQILYYAGCAVVIAGTIYLGIKYGTASVEEKAKVKQTLIFWIIVCVILIGAPTVWTLVTNIFET